MLNSGVAKRIPAPVVASRDKSLKKKDFPSCNASGEAYVSNGMEQRFKKPYPWFQGKKIGPREGPTSICPDAVRQPALEPDEESADHPLGGSDHEQLIENRGRVGGIPEQVPDADEHLPFGAA
jgi:hypothetical protein